MVIQTIYMFFFLLRGNHLASAPSIFVVQVLLHQFLPASLLENLLAFFCLVKCSQQHTTNLPTQPREFAGSGFWREKDLIKRRSIRLHTLFGLYYLQIYATDESST